MQAVMTSVTLTSIMVASSLTVTNSVTFSTLFSFSWRSSSSFIRADTASRLSRRCFDVLNFGPLAVRRARVSLICFCTSSSLTSAFTTGFTAFPFRLSLKALLPEPAAPGAPFGAAFGRLSLPVGWFCFCVMSTLSFEIRLRFSRLRWLSSPFFFSKDFTSIFPNTFGPDSLVPSPGRNRLLSSAAIRWS